MSLIINWWNIVVLALGLIATFWCNNKYNETKSRPLLTSLPGVWTSLGLLGTFLAICMSLHDVKTAEGVNADILELIMSLVPAFTTSIIGLVGALVANTLVYEVPDITTLILRILADQIPMFPIYILLHKEQ